MTKKTRSGRSGRSGITAAGTWNVDYTKTVARFPGMGSCTVIREENLHNGGAPFNLLVNLRRLGAPFPLRAIGRIGRDVDGANILRTCKSHEIGVRGMAQTAEAPTSFSDVMVDAESGVRTSFNQPGANALLAPEDFDFPGDSSRIFYLGTLFFLAGLDKRHPRHGTQAAAVLAAARKAGLLTCVDIERCHVPEEDFAAGSRAALQETDLVILNVEIAEALTGTRIRYATGIEHAAAEEAARKLMEIGQAKCVVIRSPVGALALAGSELIHEGSVRLPRSRVVNATGAGHAWAAGFLYGCHEGYSLRDCLKAAHASAAACLTHKNASEGVKSLALCMNLLQRFGQREVIDYGLPGARKSAAA